MKNTFKLIFVLFTIIYINSLAVARDNPKVFTDLAKYNAEQKMRAHNFYIDDEPQAGDTCVCHVKRNLAIALTQDTTSAVKFLQGCHKEVFSASMTEFKKEFPGDLFGGSSFNFTQPKVALDKIINAIDEGKVIGVSLNSEPIYDELSEKLHRTHTKGFADLLIGRNHALVVIGLQRNIAGDVEYLYLADSSGPGRKYAVTLNSFYRAYTSKKSYLARGVFIPNQAIYPPIRYQPIS